MDEAKVLADDSLDLENIRKPAARKAKPTVEDFIKILAEQPRTKADLLQRVQQRLGISQSPAYSLFKAAVEQYGDQIQINDKEELIINGGAELPLCPDPSPQRPARGSGADARLGPEEASTPKNGSVLQRLVSSLRALGIRKA